MDQDQTCQEELPGSNHCQDTMPQRNLQVNQIQKVQLPLLPEVFLVDSLTFTL